jgi:carbon storage regulator
MLVLTRKVNESIVIGGNIVITINQISPRRVKLGVEAPGSVPIARSEIASRQSAPSEPHAVRQDALVLEAAFG